MTPSASYPPSSANGLSLRDLYCLAVTHALPSATASPNPSPNQSPFRPFLMREDVSKWLAQLPSCDPWFQILLGLLLCLFAGVVIALMFAKRRAPMEQVHWYLAWIEFLRSYSTVIRLAVSAWLLGLLATIAATLYSNPCTNTPLSALLVPKILTDSRYDTYKFNVWLRAVGTQSYTINSVTIYPFWGPDIWRMMAAFTWDAEYKYKYGLRPSTEPLEPSLFVSPDSRTDGSTSTDVSFEMVLEPAGWLAGFASVVSVLSYHTSDAKDQGTILLGEPMRPARELAKLLGVPIRMNFHRTRRGFFPGPRMDSEEERLPETLSFSQLVSEDGVQMGLSESNDLPYLVYEELPSLNELFEWNLHDNSLSASAIRSMIPNFRDRQNLNDRIQQRDLLHQILRLFSPDDSWNATTVNPFVYDICAAFPDERCREVIVQGMRDDSPHARSSYVLRHLLFPTETPTKGERQILCVAHQFEARSDNALTRKFCGD